MFCIRHTDEYKRRKSKLTPTVASLKVISLSGLHLDEVAQNRRETAWLLTPEAANDMMGKMNKRKSCRCLSDTETKQEE